MAEDDEECELDGGYEYEVQKLVHLVVVVFAVVEDKVVEVEYSRILFFHLLIFVS